MKQKSAIVIGGSVAGMSAARALQLGGYAVTLVERDRLPDSPQTRAGTPQGRHIHALLTGGAHALECLFPGLPRDLEQAGAVPIDWINDVALINNSRAAPRVVSELRSHACTRALLDCVMRERLLREDITVIDGADVVSLQANAARDTVTGLRVRHRATQVEEALSADLVVDASGRGSHAPEWLTSLGYAAPDEQTVHSHLAYASRIVRMPATFNPGWKVLIQRLRPPHGRRAGGMYLIEGGLWQITLGGALSEQPPLDEAGFMRFIRSLAAPNVRSPQLHDLLRDAEPLTPITGFARTENRWRRFDELARVPAGFVPIGDSVCAFNPVYGQGMSVAATQAIALLAWLRGGAHDITALHAGLAAVVRTPWRLATSDDASVSNATVGKPSWATRAANAYLEALLAGSAADPVLHLAFMRVAHLTRAPQSLFAPNVAARVLPRMLFTRAARPDAKASSPAGPLQARNP